MNREILAETDSQLADPNLSSTERTALKSSKFAIENAAPDNWYDVVTNVMPTNAIKNVVKKVGTKALGNAGDVAKGAEKMSVMPHPFSEGGTHITTSDKLELYKQRGATTYGPDTGLYVVPKKQADALLSKAKTRKDIEVGLGLKEGSLSDGKLIRVDIDNPLDRKLRLPDPKTGNEFHRPRTGLTTGNLNEAVIDAPTVGIKGARKSIVRGK